MSKRKIIWKIVSKFLLLSIFFLLIILFRSANWFLSNFHEVDFSAALYQLSSPLKGTESGLLSDYVNTCLYPAIFLAVAGVSGYAFYDMMAGRIFIEADIRIGKKRLCVGGKSRKYANIRKLIILWTGIAALCACVWNRMAAVGIPAYVKNVTNESLLIESEYIDPESVAITFPEKKRNLIVIYLESMETTYASTQEGGGKPVNYIPELTKLARENVFFSDDEDLGGAITAVGTNWTMGALLAGATGVPYKLPVDGNAAGEYEMFLPGLTGLGEVLSDHGYRNYFMCGSEAVFGGRKDFYEQHGDYCILDYETAKQDGIISEDYHEFWGMEDEKLYEYARQQLTEIAGREEAFQFTLLTVDTHHPDGYLCGLCGNIYGQQYENVLACASRQASQFIDWLSQQSWYDNTTVVVLGDHVSMKTDFWDDIGDYSRRTYNCFMNLPNGVTAGQTTNRTFSTLDMFPTMLASIGVDIEGNRLGLGTNLFSEERTLPEQLGAQEFNRELSRYSNYYYQHFVLGNRTQ